jgi:diaminohydroxyphosphoribosylaminopyrimidine deaminase/5-amino-6-(5-phosphoribosylamino)uracil reductase
MVGGETARRDRPALTVRRAPGSDPTPVIISRRLSIPNDLTCLAAPALLIHGPDAPQERRERLRDRGAQLIETTYFERQPELLNLDAALESLGAEGVTHLCVEGGGHLHGAFLDARLADDVHLYIAPRLIGRGKPLFNFSSVDEIGDGWRLTQTRSETLGADIYLYGRLTLPEA